MTLSLRARADKLSVPTSSSMQNLQPIKSAAKGTPAVKLSGAQRLDKHMKMKSSNYSTEWRHFKQWLEEQTKIPTPEHGWLVKNDKSTFPKFNLSTLKTYSAWLLENYKKGALTHTQAAINYYYHEYRRRSWLQEVYQSNRSCS